MFNTQKPPIEDLPTTRQLVRATGLAIVAAGVILVAVILPAEHGVDPTGVGRVFGLTEMGEIKQQLAEEAAADEAATAAAAVENEAPPEASADARSAKLLESDIRADEMQVTLAPGEGAEIKVDMAQGSEVTYAWSVTGGTVNYDTHADGEGISYHGYDKGRNSPGESGTLVAAFDGSHGWFWRNRSGGTVTVTLRTEGAYSDIKRVV